MKRESKTYVQNMYKWWYVEKFCKQTGIRLLYHRLVSHSLPSYRQRSQFLCISIGLVTFLSRTGAIYRTIQCCMRMLCKSINGKNSLIDFDFTPNTYKNVLSRCRAGYTTSYVLFPSLTLFWIFDSVYNQLFVCCSYVSTFTQLMCLIKIHTVEKELGKCPLWMYCMRKLEGI